MRSAWPTSARDLLERIREEEIDLVLLDIEMPDVTGLDALVAIRQVYSTVRLPVIMVTARHESEDVVKALELGANDYLTKPVDFPVALARVRTHLSHMQTERGAARERRTLCAGGPRRQRRAVGLEPATTTRSTSRRAGSRCSAMPTPRSATTRRNGSAASTRPTATRCGASVDAHLDGQTPHFEAEARMLHKDGVFRWMLTRGLMIRDDAGKPWRMAGSQTDITEGKVADPMTGLPNRLLFLDRLSRLIAHQRRHADNLFAVTVRRSRRFQARQRQPRPRGRRPAADRGGQPAGDLAAADRHRRAPR